MDYFSRGERSAEKAKCQLHFAIFTDGASPLLKIPCLESLTSPMSPFTSLSMACPYSSIKNLSTTLDEGLPNPQGK
jgi:hypothetical protein